MKVRDPTHTVSAVHYSSYTQGPGGREGRKGEGKGKRSEKNKKWKKEEKRKRKKRVSERRKNNKINRLSACTTICSVRVQKKRVCQCQNVLRAEIGSMVEKLILTTIYPFIVRVRTYLRKARFSAAVWLPTYIVPLPSGWLGIMT